MISLDCAYSLVIANAIFGEKTELKATRPVDRHRDRQIWTERHLERHTRPADRQTEIERYLVETYKAGAAKAVAV